MKKILIALMVVTSLLLAGLPAFAEVTVSERNIFLFVNNNTIGLWERVSYQNPQGESITTVLPKDAEQIQGATAQGEFAVKAEDIKQTPEGLQVSIDIPQGNDVLELNYVVKPQGNIYDFAVTLNNAPQKVVFMSSGNIAVTGPQIGQGTPKQSGSMKLVEFPVNTQLKAGDVLQARLDVAPADLGQQPAQGQQPAEGQQQPAQGQQPEQPQASPLSEGYSTQFHNPGHIRLWNTSVFKKMDPHLFTALLVLLPVGGLGYYIIQRRKEKMLQTLDVEELAFQKIFNKQQELLQKIADLDSKKAAGDIEEEEYTVLRENYKHRLLQIKAQLKKLSE